MVKHNVVLGEGMCHYPLLLPPLYALQVVLSMLFVINEVMERVVLEPIFPHVLSNIVANSVWGCYLNTLIL